MKEMTLERAVEILNRNRHRGFDTWRIAHLKLPPGMLSICPILVVTMDPENRPASRDFHLNDFEAMAVAFRYKAPPLAVKLFTEVLNEASSRWTGVPPL